MPTPTLSSLALIAALGADPAPSPSPTQEALYRALVVREGAPTCAQLLACADAIQAASAASADWVAGSGWARLR